MRLEFMYLYDVKKLIPVLHAVRIDINESKSFAFQDKLFAIQNHIKFYTIYVKNK